MNEYARIEAALYASEAEITVGSLVDVAPFYTMDGEYERDAAEGICTVVGECPHTYYIVSGDVRGQNFDDLVSVSVSMMKPGSRMRRIA